MQLILQEEHCWRAEDLMHASQGEAGLATF